MKKLFIILIFLSTFIANAQGEANIWYFGEKAGLNFNTETPTAITNGQLDTREGCSSFSDADGNLLFYSDGTTIWNKNHQIMPNGSGLAGNNSSTQSAMIIPKPDSSSIYYLFTVGSGVGGGLPGFNYYTIDMDADNGLGDIIAGPINLSESLAADWTEKVAAVKGEDCNTFWVVSYVNDTFYSYKVSNAGVELTPVKTVVDYFSTDRRGYLKISPDGTKLAIAHMSNFNGNIRSAGSTFLYDFDKATGKVSNQLFLPLDYPADRPYGIEFSQRSKKLYVSASNDFGSNDPAINNNPLSHFSTLYQFDLSSPVAQNISNSKTIIDSRNLYRSGLQLGPDQKIYRTLSVSYDIGIPFLGVIEKPEENGKNCNYTHEAISLNGRNSTQGLPPFISSIFSQISITQTNENGETVTVNNEEINACIGQSFTLSQDETLEGNVEYYWFYNDIEISNFKNLTVSNIDFSNVGTYKFIAEQTDLCGNKITHEGEFDLKVYEVPEIIKPDNIEICDDDLDGFVEINLHELKDEEIINGQNTELFEVSYFNNQTDADSYSNPIEGNYINSIPFGKDLVFARIQNKRNPTCYEVENFEISIYEPPKPYESIETLGICDSDEIGNDTDGLTVFDLTTHKNKILSNAETSQFSFRFFKEASLSSSSEILNPSAYKNTSRTETIYVEIKNLLYEECTTTSQFSIEVYELPEVNQQIELKQCDTDLDGFSIFNLNEANSKIINNSSNYSFSFFQTQNGAISNISSQEIINNQDYPNQVDSFETIWVKTTDINSCSRTSQLNLIVSTTGIPQDFVKEFYACDDFIDEENDDYDGISSFNFSSVSDEIIELVPSNQQLKITYYRNEADALSEVNAITDISNYRNIGYPTTQIIWVRVDSELDNDCLGLGPHVILHVEELPVAHTVEIERQCDDDFDGIFAFETSTIHENILQDQQNVLVEYFDESGNPLPSPLPNPFVTSTQNVTVRVTNLYTNVESGPCFDETELAFIVDQKPIANEVQNILVCDDDFDGIISFDTSQIQNTILGSQNGMVVSYVDENGSQLASPLPNPYTTSSKKITAYVTNAVNANCVAETTFELIVLDKPNFEIDSEAIYCENLKPIIIESYNEKGDYTYNWFNELGDIVSTESSVIISQGGIFTAIATSEFGCESFPQTITVTASSIATITKDDVYIIDDSSNNSIEIETDNLGIGDYEFAIQKMNESISFYQETPYFDNLSAGIYSIFVQDRNNCGIAQLDVSVIGFPRFFTPNNDGYNDTWKVLGVNENFYANSNIYIFDRFGKLVAVIDPKGEGWNGLLNGSQLPSTDYWFSVELIDENGNIRIRKGNFSLIRR